ncbi:MAG: adenylyltransferase/cytidyltransferase family protein [Candidatus Methanofastidiosia archaeon]
MKVFVAGTFDILHPGHIYLLKEASKLGEVYVVVARDLNVKKLKGRKPIFSERERAEMLRSIKYVHRVVLGSEIDFFSSVERVKPDLIFLGPDQDYHWVLKELEKRELEIKVLRLSKRLEYSSSQVRRVLDWYARTLDEDKRFI